GTLEKWNLGPDVLKAINPRLVLVRVLGYGQTGPYASRAGFGSIGEAMGGLRYVCGDRKSTRLNSSHVKISYAVFCLKKKKAPAACARSSRHPATPEAYTLSLHDALPISARSRSGTWVRTS